MAQTIQFKRRVGSAGLPPTLAEGEPALNDVSAAGPANLYVGGQGGGAAVRTLISAARQVELTGTQTITTGAGNAKTFDLSNLKIGGGADEDLLQTDGAGNLDWVSISDIGGLTTVAVTSPITGDGRTTLAGGTPLGLAVAAAGDITTGTNNTLPITPAGLRGYTGALTDLTTGITQTNIIAAINSVYAQRGTPPFDATATYVIGNFVMHGGNLYRANTAVTAGPFDPSEWDRVLTEDDLDSHTITLTGDLTGTGTTSIATTLATVNTNVGTFNGLTVNGKGLVTGAVEVVGALTGLTTGITNTSIVAAINFLHTSMSDGSLVAVQVSSPITGDGRTTAAGGNPLGLSTVPITLGGTGAITGPLALDGLSGVTGATTGVLTRSSAGVWSLGTAFAGITLEPGTALSGDGTSGDPLDFTVATVAQVTADPVTDNIHPITATTLRNQLGQPATATNLGTTATTIVPAIKELADRTAALVAAIVLIGTYDLVNVTPTAGSPFGPTPGALPTAVGHTGWAVILTAAGPGVAPAPAGPLAIGDWLVSNGTDWVHIPLHHPATAAANVTVSAITGMTGITNVQAALQWLHDNTLGSIEVDGVSIVGDGLTTGTALAVGAVDGGTYT